MKERRAKRAHGRGLILSPHGVRFTYLHAAGNSPSWEAYHLLVAGSIHRW
jgi:hypothetical protein